MTFSRQILVGLAAGVAVGLFLGEMVGPLAVVADGFVKLLQMTVLPYVTVSIITSLGTIDLTEAKSAGLRAGAVLAGLWLIALLFACSVSARVSLGATASFFSTSLLEKPPPFDFIDLYIPSNPFFSLANNIVPAVVLFSVILGVALIGVERKAVLLDILRPHQRHGLPRDPVHRPPDAVRHLRARRDRGRHASPRTGRADPDLSDHLRRDLAAGVVMGASRPDRGAHAHPVSRGAGPTRGALITAFIAGDLFIVLPILTEACKELLSVSGTETRSARACRTSSCRPRSIFLTPASCCRSVSSCLQDGSPAPP